MYQIGILAGQTCGTTAATSVPRLPCRPSVQRHGERASAGQAAAGRVVWHSRVRNGSLNIATSVHASSLCILLSFCNNAAHGICFGVQPLQNLRICVSKLVNGMSYTHKLWRHGTPTLHTCCSLSPVVPSFCCFLRQVGCAGHRLQYRPDSHDGSLCICWTSAAA
jgi:hypothetical protein